MNIHHTYRNKKIIRITFVIVAIAIMLISTFFTNRLAKKLAIEEKKKVELWAEATKQLILANEENDISFLLKIIEDNTTIPVIMTNFEGEIVSYRNLKDSTYSIDSEYLEKRLEKMKKAKEPIIVNISKEVKQYIYYDDSFILKQLQVFPYVQIIVVALFFIIIFLVFSSSKRAEQNRVWVGLSKETAHQLGTPISSMLAWTELLKLKYPSDKLIFDMEKDVNRLGVVADRFSKIGSKPNLKPSSLNTVVENAVQYIKSRSSNEVKINVEKSEQDVLANLNIPLFEWVIENLCKNAIDAMEGSGRIDILIKRKEDNLIIDVKDTGKGMPKSMYKNVFLPGFTTKQRGWGLGLSLAKRIIEEYHKGKIFVKQSEINVGTTFRIVLPF